MIGWEIPVTVLAIGRLFYFYTQHDDDYCGIVCTNSREHPSYIKIFDPHNLGVSCGYSEKPPLPGWILSRIPPIELEEALYPTASRRRWWEWIFE